MEDGPEYDCQQCGACCVQQGPFDGNAYVYLHRQEACTVRGLSLPVLQTAMGAFCQAAAEHEGTVDRPACVAFRGQLGGVCGCTVYQERPSVCRDYEVGGRLCREAREQAGLPT